MRDEPTPHIVGFGEERLSLGELAELSGLEVETLVELVQAGLLPAGGGSEGAAVFGYACVRVARRAGRLRRDFDLSEAGTVLALTLLERIDALEDRLIELQGRGAGE